ncbi:MAG: tRNA1(Val) (adenine(37)-N6)-methyltransferase [Deltaproteobacteria bacterium]
MISIKNDETMDAVGNGKVKVIQQKNGYRFSLDAILLSAFVEAKHSETILEIGVGSGVAINIILSRFAFIKRAIGVEIQKELADIATRNIALNEFSDKTRIIHADINQYASIFPRASFDVVFFNPPYRKCGSGKINPNQQKAIARHELKGNLKNFLEASSYLLGDGGRVYLVYPATRIAQLFVEMKKQNIEPKKVVMVHSRKSTPAKLILVSGIKSAKEGVNVAPPLFIYAEDIDDKYSVQMDTIFSDYSFYPATFSE